MGGRASLRTFAECVVGAHRADKPDTLPTPGPRSVRPLARFRERRSTLPDTSPAPGVDGSARNVYPNQRCLTNDQTRIVEPREGRGFLETTAAGGHALVLRARGAMRARAGAAARAAACCEPTPPRLNQHGETSDREHEALHTASLRRRGRSRRIGPRGVRTPDRKLRSAFPRAATLESDAADAGNHAALSDARGG